MSPGPWFPQFEQAVQAARRVFVVSDFDGTLVSFRHTDDLLPASRRKLLERLCRARGTEFAILSGRTMKELRKLARVRGARLFAEHGADEGTRSRDAVTGRPQRWLREVMRLVPLGARIEMKRTCLCFHLRHVTPTRRERFAQSLRRYAEAHRDGIRMLAGHLVLELQPPAAHKGEFTRNWLRRRGFDSRRDVAVYLGDHETDEEAFRSLGRHAWTFRVRPDGRTDARRTLRGVADVEQLLARLVRARGNGASRG